MRSQCSLPSEEQRIQLQFLRRKGLCGKGSAAGLQPRSQQSDDPTGRPPRRAGQLSNRSACSNRPSRNFHKRMVSRRPNVSADTSYDRAPTQPADADYPHSLAAGGTEFWRKQSDPEEWARHFWAMTDAIRSAGVEAPIYVAQCTICCNDPNETIRAVQRRVVNPAAGIFRGPDIDLIGRDERYDGCHLSGAGPATCRRAMV